jgi:hypothetical protein
VSPKIINKEKNLMDANESNVPESNVDPSEQPANVDPSEQPSSPLRVDPSEQPLDVDPSEQPGGSSQSLRGDGPNE